jgi:hypothetical protein
MVSQAQSDTVNDGNAFGSLDTSTGPGLRVVVGAGGAVTGAAGSGGGGGAVGSRPCAILPAQPQTSGADTFGAFPPTLTDAEVAAGRTASLTDGGFYVRYCLETPGLWELVAVFQFQEGTPAPVTPVIAPEALAQLALAQIVVPKPRPATAPAIDVDTLVGIETWLWVDRAQWQPLTASAEAGGLRVTATVTPQRVTWDMGEGRGKEPVVCQGPGTPYRQDVRDKYQHTSCGYVYQWASFDHPAQDDPRAAGDDRYHASATITWSVAWSASNGAEGTLADLRSTAPFALRVDDVQAVVCYNTRLGDCHADAASLDRPERTGRRPWSESTARHGTLGRDT